MGTQADEARFARGGEYPFAGESLQELGGVVDGDEDEVGVGFSYVVAGLSQPRGEVPGPRMYVAGNIVGWGGPWSLSFTGRPPENLNHFRHELGSVIDVCGGQPCRSTEGPIPAP